MQGLNELSCARVSATHAFGSFDHSFSRHFEWKLWADLAGQWSEIIGWNAVEGVQWLGPQECPTDAPDNSHPPQPSSWRRCMHACTHTHTHMTWEYLKKAEFCSAIRWTWTPWQTLLELCPHPQRLTVPVHEARTSSSWYLHLFAYWLWLPELRSTFQAELPSESNLQPRLWGAGG